MGIETKLKNLNQMPWFLLPYDAGTSGPLAVSGMLVSNNVPESVSSSQTIKYTDKPVPGGYTSLTEFNNIGAEKISFTIKMGKFNDNYAGGVTDIVQFFKSLRRSTGGLFSGGQKLFRQNAKVIYWYGTGAPFPLAYYVTKVEPIKTSRFNKYGAPQVVEVSMELTVDTAHRLYQAELIWQKVAQVKTLTSILKPFQSIYGNPYYRSGILTT